MLRNKGWGIALALQGLSLSCFGANTELESMLARVMAYNIAPATGFVSAVQVPTGQLYDPLVMHVHGEEVWLNDDGKEAGDKGSRLLAVTPVGKVSVLVDANRMLPISAGFDIAPNGFGEFAGQIFALSQPRISDQGGKENYVIQRIDPAHDYSVSVFCTLPGTVNKKVGGIGVDAAFGPAGSPFAGKLFASTTLNETIYQITPDGKCVPFVTLDPQRHGGPLYLRFALDGQSLLITVVRGGIFAATGGAVLRVVPDGTVQDKPLVESPTILGSLDFAPPGFGRFAGELFVTEVGYYEIPVPLGQALRADGKVHRVTAEGKLALVASAFINPWCLRFVGNRLWVGDINGDFIYGKRELPDGFIVTITSP
ncbi:MAG: hypothetical protein EXR86_11590 [Gammaproteobacteria bacterium]|nr:hypothetical protein [Gammaproteobacteria bacterium]